MKKILIVLGVIFAICVGGIGIAIAFFSFSGSGIQKEAQEFSAQAINTLGNDWDTSEVFKIMAPEALSDLKIKKQTEDILGVIKNNLGGLNHFDSLNGTYRMGYQNGKKYLIAEYRAKIFCQKDSGRIDIQVEKDEGKWMLRKFFVNSDAFIKQLKEN